LVLAVAVAAVVMELLETIAFFPLLPQAVVALEMQPLAALALVVCLARHQEALELLIKVMQVVVQLTLHHIPQVAVAVLVRLVLME
jgi:hypothetical protein